MALTQPYDSLNPDQEVGISYSHWSQLQAGLERYNVVLAVGKGFIQLRDDVQGHLCSTCSSSCKQQGEPVVRKAPPLPKHNLVCIASHLPVVQEVQ